MLKNAHAKKIFAAALVVLTTVVSYSQNNAVKHSNFTIKTTESIQKVQVLIKSIPVVADANLTYYWYAMETIHKTKGGFDGDLLHGVYTSYYLSGDLKEKGMFSGGLKVGEWKEWYPNGELKSITNWRKGQLWGAHTTYTENGVIKSHVNYKAGVLSDKDTEVEEEPVKEKKRSLNPKKNSDNKSDDVESKKMPLGDKLKNTWNAIFKGKKDKETESTNIQ